MRTFLLASLLVHTAAGGVAWWLHEPAPVRARPTALRVTLVAEPLPPDEDPYVAPPPPPPPVEEPTLAVEPEEPSPELPELHAEVAVETVAGPDAAALATRLDRAVQLRPRSRLPAPRRLVTATPAPKRPARTVPPRLLRGGVSYPPRAHRRGLEGRVLLLLRIGARGKVLRAELAKSSGHALLDEAALRQARRWLFEPARRAGRAVAHAVRVPVRFATP